MLMLGIGNLVDPEDTGPLLNVVFVAGVIGLRRGLSLRGPG